MTGVAMGMIGYCRSCGEPYSNHTLIQAALHERDEALFEVERLRIENKNLQGDVMDSDHNELVQLRAEIERVRDNHVTVAEEVQRRHDAGAPLVAEIERLRKALERYGEHETGCVMGDRCNCGLLAALRSDRTP